MSRARTSALVKLTAGGIVSGVVLGCSQAAIAAPVETVPCQVGALGAAIAGASAGETVFTGNHGSDGGAISSNTGVSGPVVNDSIFIANQATDAGGAIYNNSALSGVSATGSTFTGNVAAGEGGAIWDPPAPRSSATSLAAPAGASSTPRTRPRR